MFRTRKKENLGLAILRLEMPIFGLQPAGFGFKSLYEFFAIHLELCAVSNETTQEIANPLTDKG